MNNKNSLSTWIMVIALVLLLLQDRDLNPNPDPDPEPTPPEELLIPVEGVSVLLVAETSQYMKYTRQQQQLIDGYLWTDATTNNQYRILDPDTTFTVDVPYKDAFNRHPPAVQGELYQPWCVISGPGKQYEGLAPGSAEEMLTKVEAAK